jgi:uncharacterized protein involved in exopolysaccharide biosynthesis
MKQTKNTDVNEKFQNLIQLWKMKKFIFWNTFIFAVLSVLISLLMPKWYASSAEIVSVGSNTSSFLSMLSGMPITEFGLGSLNEDISNYIAIIESRTIREKTVKEFNLIERYKSKDLEFATEALSEKVTLTVSDEGTLIIEVIDKDPELARNITVFLLNELDMKNRALASEKGKFNRTFLEERLEKSYYDLEKAEDSLRIFQKKYGLIDVPNQVMKAIEVYAQMYAQKVQAKIQYKVAQASYNVDDPKILQYKIVLDQFNAILDSMIYSGDDKNVLVAFANIPDLGLEYARLFREVELQSKILEFLLPQFEQARMEETKNTPSLQIIDYPQIAINKAKPQRALIVIATTLMAGLFSVFYVLFEFRSRELRYALKNK